ncbi:MAG: phenolic acid decarboxylase subunit B, partial [Spirochaetaceae bacterium]|nr:phenolic acid decarboxylase subunit B [Spirochaetaceae bacterium]
DLRNLTTAAEAGATVLPAAPAFYHAPQTINDIIDFIVGKTLDQLNIEHTLYQRWKQPNDKGQKI